jgi:hypothetical protein
MDFSEKYISTTDKAKDVSSKKIVISDDSFAVCEMLKEVAFRLSRMR